MTIYELRYQQQSREFEVLSSDGLRYSVEVTVRYRLLEQWLGLLHKCVGPHYVDTMLLPEVGAVTRLVTAQLRPDELYTSQRQASEAAIRQHLRLEISSCAPRQGGADANDDALMGVANPPRSGERYFEASDVFIRRVVLPPRVAEAIEAKLVQRQQMLEYDYRVDRERKEAERKGIEAEGLRVYNETVSRGLSANVLHWHALQATLELAKSPNSKLLVMGSSDKGGLPLLLGSPAAWDPVVPAPVGTPASGARPAASSASSTASSSAIAAP
jgi:regulator of protease activity HflC (stomatin/prohibitin superfamily)